MAQDNRLLPLSHGGSLDRPLRELTQPERPNNTYSSVEPTHLREYLAVVLKRKWLILSLAVVVTSLVAIQMYRLPSVYEAQTTIQIEQKSKNIIKTKELVLNASNDPAYWGTQLKLLENPRLARKVILALDLQNNPAFLNNSAHWFGSNFSFLNSGMKSLYPNLSGGPKCSVCHFINSGLPYICFAYHSLWCAGTS